VVAVTLSNTIGTLRMLKGFQANSLMLLVEEQEDDENITRENQFLWLFQNKIKNYKNIEEK
jgi:hypothetical protein